MITVDSRAIHAIDYNELTRTLRVRFTSSSRIYDVLDVPRHHFQGLLAAESKGDYYNHYIRDQFEVC